MPLLLHVEALLLALVCVVLICEDERRTQFALSFAATRLNLEFSISVWSNAFLRAKTKFSLAQRYLASLKLYNKIFHYTPPPHHA